MWSHGWTRMSLAVLLGLLSLTATYPLNDSYPLLNSPKIARAGKICDSPKKGYQCFAASSHRWAQYAPFFSVETQDGGISNEIPEGCQVDFVQMISRHGARYPTKGKGEKYQALLKKIQTAATLTGEATFLKSYKYILKTDSLVAFGEQELVNAGIRFNERYPDLSSENEPFIRSTSSERVMKSAEKFVEGFQQSRGRSTTGANVPTIGTIISNEPGNNNTLNHNTCPHFEATYNKRKHEGMDNFVASVMPSIRDRLKTVIKGVDLSDTEILQLMELCGFDTVAATDNANKKSPFCDLFTELEWKNYEYSQSLSKYYAFGWGNPLGPTQGIGFLNELSARLTGKKVQDATTVDHNLDSNPKHFPLNRAIYLDFTHDNGMIPIYSAMGLYKKPLSKTEFQTAADSDGFSLSWVVPFAARAYIERMTCCTEPDEPSNEEQQDESSGKDENLSDGSLIRLIVNERVVPLQGCNPDQLGRCTQKDFIKETLKWARSNGNWQDCYPEPKV